MKIDSNFKNLTLKEKVQEVININKDRLVTSNGLIDQFIYLVDNKNFLYAVPIENKKYIEDKEYTEIFRGILKSIISDYAYRKINITYLFYIREGYFNSKHSNLQDINLDTTFDKYNSNECLLVYNESKLSMELTIFDKITGRDQGIQYTVLSENPIKKLKYCKIDPDDNLKGALTNILR